MCSSTRRLSFSMSTSIGRGDGRPPRLERPVQRQFEVKPAAPAGRCWGASPTAAPADSRMKRPRARRQVQDDLFGIDQRAWRRASLQRRRVALAQHLARVEPLDGKPAFGQRWPAGDPRRRRRPRWARTPVVSARHDRCGHRDRSPRNGLSDVSAVSAVPKNR